MLKKMKNIYLIYLLLIISSKVNNLVFINYKCKKTNNC
jgi:hypothetical protein